MNVELAKRAVACKGWRWLPGCVPMDGYPQWGDGALPDLDAPATKGALLGLIREARHDPALYVHPYGHGWRWRSNYRDCSAIYDTEAEALVAALEAAPC